NHLSALGLFSSFPDQACASPREEQTNKLLATKELRMRKLPQQRYPLEVDDADELADLPADQVVIGEQLAMRPGQTLTEKAKELGVTPQTLRLYHLEWRGSGYDPEYRILRARHSNWLRTKWKDRDWPEALRQQIARGQHRHVGDLLLALGVTGAN